MNQSNYIVTTNPTTLNKKNSSIFISGIELAKWREKAGLTQDEIASMIGKNRVTITRWEKQKQIKVSYSNLEVIKKAINVTTEQLQESTAQNDILDHPLVKSLVDQSKYIMSRVNYLEEENKKLKERLEQL